MKAIKIRTIVEGTVEGIALVSPIPISFFGGVDAETGIITDSENPLFGESLTDKIFVFPESKGSTVGSYVIYGLSVNNVAPLALIANKAETIVIAGAILALSYLFFFSEKKKFYPAMPFITAGIFIGMVLSYLVL